MRYEGAFYFFLPLNHYYNQLFLGQFWLCCCIALSLLQVVSTILMLPGLLTTGQVLWFSCLVVPLISISLMAKPIDKDVMKKPQGKNQNLTNWHVSIST